MKHRRRHDSGSRCSKEDFLIGTTTELGSCRVRIEADRPCPPAVVETRGVPFRERCAREQEAYFAIGGLTQELPGGRSKLRTSAPGSARRNTGPERWGFAGERLAEAEKRLKVVKQ